MNTKQLSSILVAALALALAGAAALTGCTGDNPVSSTLPSGDDAGLAGATDREMIHMWGDDPPAGLVPVTVMGETLEFWPYTGASFDGSPVDPVNLVFTGKADPVRIRAALLALDGDRTAFGIPDFPPFNATWSEAIGDVQTTFADGDGWTGSAIQLQLGDYQPLRVHLRLFQTNRPFGGDGTWTLGGAHFEVMIPGTADHEVLSWEIAEQMVVVDLVRSGLLGAPPATTGPINQAPAYRAINHLVYNELPDELKMLLTGSTAPSPVPVPIVSDGQGTVLHLAGEAPVVPGVFPQTRHFAYDLVMPKPFCLDGPFDYVHVAGPITFTKTAEVDGEGRYRYHSGYQARLTVTPVDVTQSPPVPAGEPFMAVVTGTQEGLTRAGFSQVSAIDRRVGPQDGGAELLMSRLKVGTEGRNSYRLHTACLDDTP